MSGRVALPGCYLTGGQEDGDTLQYVLHLTGGKTLADVRQALPAIASALGMDPGQFGFDYFPPGPNGFRDTSKLDMRVALASPITGHVFHEGPRYAYRDGFGLVEMGPFVTGGAAACYELFKTNGMNSGIAIGSSDAGKSSLINGILVGARSTGGVCVAYFDPKGNSNPDLARNATVAETDMARFEAFTQAVEQLTYWLGRQDEIDNRSGYRPEGYRPAYVIVIDECDIPFRIKGMGRRYGIITKQLRAVGGGLLLATQYAGLEAFGGDDFLRSSLRAGNVILMRTESNTSDNLIAPELPSSLTLPRGEPGNFYLRNKHALPFRARGAHLLRSDEAPPPDFPEHLAGWNADTAYRRYPDAEPCPVFRRAFREFLVDGDQEHREQVRAVARQRDLDAWLRGEANTGQPAPATSTPAGLDGVAGIAERFAALHAAGGAKVIPLQRRTGHAGDPPMNPTRKAILAAVRELGRCENKQIHAEVPGVSPSAMTKHLRWLTERSLVRDLGYAGWEPAGQQETGTTT